MNPHCIAFVDVDDVLVDTHEEFRSHLNDRFGLNLPEGFMPRDWSYNDVVPLEAQNERWFYEFPTDWVGRVKAYPGARRFLDGLREMEVRVVLVSKTPEGRVVDRIRNLTRQGFKYDEYLAVALKEKKSDFINATLERYPDSYWLYLDDSSTEIGDVLTNCPAVPPHRIITMQRPYTEDWLRANPTKARGAFWASDIGQAYRVALSTAEASLVR